MSLHDNALDEAWLEWFAGCYRTNAHDMDEAQRSQLEMAFYAGAAFGGRVGQSHGHQVVVDAINAHIERTKGTCTHCPRCDVFLSKGELLDGEACPRCKLVLPQGAAPPP